MLNESTKSISNFKTALLSCERVYFVRLLFWVLLFIVNPPYLFFSCMFQSLTPLISLDLCPILILQLFLPLLEFSVFSLMTCVYLSYSVSYFPPHSFTCIFYPFSMLFGKRRYLEKVSRRYLEGIKWIPSAHSEIVISFSRRWRSKGSVLKKNHFFFSDL